MGMRFRKSVNLGRGLRINISKSGIGYSWGTKTARITKTARGTTRSTYTIPGTGFSYVNESSKSGRISGHRSARPAQQSLASGDDSRVISTERVNVEDYQPVEYEELLARMKRAQRLDLISSGLIVTVVLAAFPPFIFTAAAGVILKIIAHTKMKIRVNYSLDEEAQAAYDDLSAVWMTLNKNQKFWQRLSERNLDERRNGGASRGISRIPAQAISSMPFFLETNVRPFGLKLRKQKVYFLPDKMLVVSRTQIGAISYVDVDMGFGTTQFIETESVPDDAKVMRYTWLKVNKDGSPDKRFKDNKQVPVCEYGVVLIKSGTILHIELMCSNSKTVKEMRDSAQRFVRFIN